MAYLLNHALKFLLAGFFVNDTVHAGAVEGSITYWHDLLVSGEPCLAIK
jgi:hypothetical protein